jgi:NitT/TauT family transport system permease protein
VKRFIGFLLPIGLFLGWQLGSQVGLIKPLFFPAPSTIVNRLYALILDGTVPTNLFATLMRVLIGVGVGGGIGLAIGLAMGLSERISKVLDGLVAATHPMPKIALLPLFLVIFGYGENARLILVALSATFPLIIASRTAVQAMDPLLLDVCKSYGIKGQLQLRRMVLPACLPIVLAGLRLAISTALIVTISVEMLAANDGLGSLLWFGWQTMRLEDIYAVLLVIALFGLVVNKAITC